MDFELTPEQREIQTLAREVADAEIAPNASAWDRDHRFPDELYPKLAALGLMGVCIPEEYGGAGADFLSYVLVLEELSRADASVGVTVAVHTSAEPDGDGWRINGSKQWITNGSRAGTFLLFARTAAGTAGARGISSFVLDASHVRITREEEKLGLNSSTTSDLVLEGAIVEPARLL